MAKSGSSGAAAAGVFVAGLVVLLVSIMEGWTGLGVLSAAAMLGSLVASAVSRRTQDPTVTLGPGREDRPWRKRSGPEG